MVTSSWQQAITRTWGGDYWANFLRSAIFQFSKYMLAIEYHVHIIQVSPQLSWGDTSHISKWLNEPNRYSCNINFFLTEKFSNGDLSNSIPALIKTLGTKWYNQILHMRVAAIAIVINNDMLFDVRCEIRQHMPYVIINDIFILYSFVSKQYIIYKMVSHGYACVILRQFLNWVLWILWASTLFDVWHLHESYLFQ